MVEDPGCGITDVKKYFVERTVSLVAPGKLPQAFRVSQGSERTVNGANNLAQEDFRRRAFQKIATLGSAHAFNEARCFQVEKDQLQKLLGNIL